MVDEQDDKPQRAGTGRESRSAVGPNDTFAVRALLRGLQILSCFDMERPEWTLVELSERTELSKATTYRLARNLEAMGFLVFDHDKGKYYLGTAMIRAAHIAQSHSQRVRVAHPILRELAASTGETANLGIPTLDGIVVADQVLTSRIFKPTLPVGRIHNIHSNLANAHCKLYAAYIPPDQQASLLAQPLTRLTEYTIVDRQSMEAELARIVDWGVAYDMQEQSLGVCAVAAPVFDLRGEVKASIAVVVPVERASPEGMKRHTEAVKEAAAVLSQHLGYA